ncbi:MAG: sigma-E factor negative regulatory protein RseB [Pseudohongiellaceae bacterium]|jgi:sigma-E factor negative regulatory protein RseB
MVLRGLASIFFLLSASLWVYAGESTDPNQWLEKMSRSHRELNYQGLFTYEQADTIQSMRIFHALIDGEEYERLERLNSGKMNVIRRGHGPMCMHVGDKLIHLLQEQYHGDGGIAHFYDFSIVGKDRVANRSVVELAIMPRDEHRFGHRLSLDEGTGILLRAVQYSTENKVLERFQFVDVTLDSPLSMADFQGQANHQQVRHIEPELGKVLQYGWRVSWVPGGFKASPQAPQKQQAIIESQIYTDGLAVFSVFVERHDPNSPAAGIQGRAQRGATMAYSRAFQLNGEPYRVTVVGEIPQTTAERIAASIVSSS